MQIKLWSLLQIPVYVFGFELGQLRRVGHQMVLRINLCIALVTSLIEALVVLHANTLTAEMHLHKTQEHKKRCEPLAFPDTLPEMSGILRNHLCPSSICTSIWTSSWIRGTGSAPLRGCIHPSRDSPRPGRKLFKDEARVVRERRGTCYVASLEST